MPYRYSQMLPRESLAEADGKPVKAESNGRESPSLKLQMVHRMDNRDN
jgi:hypothetical protein